jgi:2Fe-2S ferredoxin
MPKITISNQGQKVVEYKLNNEAPMSILAILQENNIDWMHACGGKGKCTSCRCNIIEGDKNLAAKTEVEKNYLEAGRLLETQRLTCQAVPSGDVLVSVPKKNKLPGVNYSN